MFESIKNLFGGESTEKSPEETRIAELEKEREGLKELNKGRPEQWGTDPRFEEINREIETLKHRTQEKK